MTNDRKSHQNSLRTAREEQGWSQTQLAQKIGTTNVNVSRWERGAILPSPYYREQLGKVFHKTPAELGLIPPSSPNEKIWNMPTTRNPFFIGRERLLSHLHDQLLKDRTAALVQRQPQALFGLGGIGKTQTAAEYAFRYAGDYAGVFWVRAASRETLVADFVTLADLLELPTREQQDQSQIVAAVKRWLAAHDSWLLIMDNADDLRMAQEFLPPSHKGYILFTTRAQAAGRIAASIEVEKLPLQEGVVLLLRWSNLLDVGVSLDKARAEDRTDAEQIVQEMDGLPLALVQAGAYVDETGCSLAEYLRLYATYRKELLERRSSLAFDYAETVATTWSLSFQQVEQQSSTAADVLRLCAFLAADAIPVELILQGITEGEVAPGNAASDTFRLNQAMEVLRKYSLVLRDGRTNTLSIHRLVQAVFRESMDEQTQRYWAERTVRAVNAAFPEADYARDSPHQHYLPHAQECATLINEYHLHFPEAAQVLYKAGIFLYNQGFYPQSQALHQQALAIRKKVFGSEHPDVADSLNALGMLFRIHNDFEQAESFYQQALIIRKKTLGPEHFATVESLNNLGVLYRNQDKYEQAELLFQKALRINERSLGSEHPKTLITSLNLAKLYAEQDKYEQAERLLKQALTTSQRSLKPDHPLIAHNLNLLARFYFEQGNYGQAETPWKISLAIVEKTHGPEHPVTAERLHNLAELYFAQGRYIEAQSLCKRALNIFEKTFGPEHSNTIAYREHLNKIKEEQSGDHHPTPPL